MKVYADGKLTGQKGDNDLPEGIRTVDEYVKNYLSENGGGVDYVHGEENLKKLVLIFISVLMITSVFCGCGGEGMMSEKNLRTIAGDPLRYALMARLCKKGEMLLFAVGMALFAGVGMANMNYSVLVATYALKGLAYPLFAYTFIVWITYRVGKSELGTAQGWFWVMCTGGMDVLGAYYGAFAKTEFGVVTALWTAVAFASVGAAMALWLNRSEDKNLFGGDEAAPESEDKGSKIKELVRGLTIIKDEPKVLMGGIVRMINTLSYFAFLVFMPLYLMSYGIDDSQWATIWGAAFFCNIIFNLVFGVVGDRIGWGRTVKFFG